jgi:hypothetical protein
MAFVSPSVCDFPLRNDFGDFASVALISPEFESDFASGHLTSFPIITSTPGPAVPEGGSSLIFLGFAILSMALVEGFLGRSTL